MWGTARKCFIWSVVLGLLFSGPVSAAVLDERIMISSSPNPVGSGARATGMGGAFIAIADDATAASWNPGGLFKVQRPEISMVGSFLNRSEDAFYSAYPGSGTGHDISQSDLNYFSMAYPFSIKNMQFTASLNFQHMFDFGKEAGLGFTRNNNVYDYRYRQDGSLYSLSPSLGVLLTRDMSVGFTYNRWDDSIRSNRWQVDYFQDVVFQVPGGSALSRVDHSDVYTFEGDNFHVGFLWEIIADKVTIGGVYKSEFEADLRHEHFYHFSQQGFDNYTYSAFDEKINMPMSFGIGIAMNVKKGVRVALDVYRTLWDDYYIETSSGDKISPISGKPLNEVSISPTTQVRLGAEIVYDVFDYKVPVRGGIFYDPEPSEGSPDDFFGFTLGAGLYFNRIEFDASYQFRFGRDVREVEIGGGSSTTDVDEHSINFSIIYMFWKGRYEAEKETF